MVIPVVSRGLRYASSAGPLGTSCSGGAGIVELAVPWLVRLVELGVAGLVGGVVGVVVLSDSGTSLGGSLLILPALVSVSIASVSSGTPLTGKLRSDLTLNLVLRRQCPQTVRSTPIRNELSLRLGRRA